MKKVLPVLVLASLLAVLILPMVALAQAPPEELPVGCKMRYEVGVTGCPGPGGYCIVPPIGTCPGVCCLLNTVYTATSWFFYILIILSVIMIIWGGFHILFAAGDPEKMKKGRGTIIYALVGIAIALFARVIPSIVKFMMAV